MQQMDEKPSGLLGHFGHFQVPVHDQLNHGFGELQEVLGFEDGAGTGLHEGEDHVDQLAGWAVSPVVVLQGI